MTPGAFDAKTAREITGDAQARDIEARARADADAGVFAPPPTDGETYWGRVQHEMARVVYSEQHARRTARNVRKAHGIGIQ